MVLLAELKLMQAIDVAASSAWGRDTECRKIRVPAPRAGWGGCKVWSGALPGQERHWNEEYWLFLQYKIIELSIRG